MKRRKFLDISSKMVASAPILLNSMQTKAFSLFSMSQDCFDQQDRAIVLIQMGGGNDGLNTIIPFQVDTPGAQYEMYKSLRPTIKIPEADLSCINLADLPENHVSLHPRMDSFKYLYEKGNASIVQSTGYINQSRSHFQGTDLILKGMGNTASSPTYNDGWMGRFLGNFYAPVIGNPDYPMQDPVGIQLGNRKPSLGFLYPANNRVAVNISNQNPASFHAQISQSGLLPPECIVCPKYQSKLDHITEVEYSLDLYSNRITQVYNLGKNSTSVTYANTRLEKQLKTVARLINGGCRTKVYLVYMTGFDTHVDQVLSGSSTQGKHATLLAEFSNGVRNFLEDLEAMGYGDKVSVLSFSEFGRTADENGGSGTDHGGIAPMLLAGNGINAGVFGAPPKLDVLVSRAPTTEHLTDYRTVLGVLIRDWLGANSDSLDAAGFSDFLGGSDEPALIKPGFVADTTCGPLHDSPASGTVVYTGTISILNEGSENLPIQEITACDVVVLEPDTTIPFGANVRIFPSICPTVPSGAKQALSPTEEFESLVEKNEIYSSVAAYPNPFTSKITISVKPEKDENNIRISIVDTLGRLVDTRVVNRFQSKGYFNYTFEASHLPTGIYFIVFVSEKKQEAFQIMKVN